MTYKTHISTGILFSSIVFLLLYEISLDPWLIAILIFATFLGSSTPDLDTPSGGLWQKVPGGSILSRIINPIFIGGHRHLSHSFLGMGLFVSLFWFLINLLPLYILHDTYYLILCAFCLGYASHLFADLFTEAGVPLLFPIGYHFGIPPDPLKKVRIKTGKWFENLIVYPAVNIAILWVIWQYLN